MLHASGIHMIRIDDVNKSFRVAPGPRRKARVVEAVRAVTASLEAGSIIGVVGPNGAGKSTLFGLILGFLEATSGMITIDDLEPRSYVRRHGASYLPERFQLPRDWTLRSAIRALLALDSSDRSADDILAEYELTEYANAAAHTLSRGTMQRVGIAQALATPRNLIVLDEPTEGLDPLWRVRFRETVRNLRHNDRTILIASHDLVEIERTVDRVLILQDGTITENLELHSDRAAARDYSLQLAASHPAVNETFPGAVPVGEAGYTIRVADAADLSARLGALIDAGAIVIAVQPAADLEQRVTRAAHADPH